MQSPKKYTNKLAGETSPYLLQHAHNPVDWYPWGDEAFERARAEDKPVLVSIGYSACHWCHVMEHESFEDEATARVQNEHFINIKVDMEERPDVDQIYMNFVQITTGRGGWPMNVFVTPEKVPFFGGTYFPPQPRYGMPSWQQVMVSIAEAWRERRDELMQSANEILGELRRLSSAEIGMSGVDEQLSEHAYKNFVKNFDAKNGGFGGAPKFPPSMALEFLLRYWKRTGDEGALEIVAKTAEMMAKGGMYDQLGGGFHRYAVDAIWLVPHFEKMLYDNAQLIRIYLHLYQIFRAREAEENGGEPPFRTANGEVGSDFFKRVAVETLEYVSREMTDAKGGFYSSQDADSEGEEGKFFVWTPEEIVEVLGEEDARKFCALYDVTKEGNFEGKNILNIRGGIKGDLGSKKELGGSFQLSADSSQREAWKERLFEHREKRVKPFRDEKVLTAWNGLMLAAFAEAAAVLGDARYLESAKKNADFVLEEMTHAGKVPAFRLLRTWKDGRAKLNGYIEDYANFADGLIELYQVSGEDKYLHAARELADAMITGFWDEENGGFFFTSNDHEELIVRNKDFVDNATPSGNSVAADVLLKLAKFYGGAEGETSEDTLPNGRVSARMYERFAGTTLRLAAGQIRRYPNGFGRALSAIEFLIGDVKEIAIVGTRGSQAELEVWSDYRPFKVVATGGDVPLLEGREAIDGKATVYVCENFVCQRPVTGVEELRDLL